jgi:cell division protein FtsI/penicillin-binding protein 2
VTGGMEKRAAILSTAILFGFVLVAVRLADLMLLDHDRLSARAQNQYKAETDMKVARGKIFDRKGRELAVNVDVLSVYANPPRIENLEETARVVSQTMGKKYKPVLRDLKSTKGFVWLARKLDYATGYKVRQLNIEGIDVVPEVGRFYPKGALASHVVGFVGVDNQPLEGVELRYNKNLHGWEERVAYQRDAGGRILTGGLNVSGGGSSLVLTIDETLQFIAEQALKHAVDEWKAASATAVMMNPYTGEILAMANMPNYDLNTPGSVPTSWRRNRAITDSYEPGSTFKLMTAAAAIEEGRVKLTDTFDTSKGFIRVAGKAIWDTSNHGVISFPEVIRRSSNVGTVMIGQRLEPEEFYKYVRSFGFGRKTGIDLPGESAGKVEPPTSWSETSHAAMSIGYEVAATPLQILRAYSAVANGGVMVTPHVVSKIISAQGDITYEFSEPFEVRAISQHTADTLKDILITVTQAGGTATVASVPGNRVAGKTGTTRLLDPETGKYSRKKYASSFVGFVPADMPKIALIVVVFEPQGKYYGGLVAAPVFRLIAEQTLAYLNVPREDDYQNNMLVVKRVSRSR